MKKRLAILIILILALSLSAATYGEPTPSPSPTAGAGGAVQLISYGSTGETVVRIQLRLRELGYFNYKPTGNFQSMTVDSTKVFQQNQTDADGLPIIADGTVGAQTLSILFTPGVKRVDIAASIPIGQQLAGSATVTGELVPWSEVKELLNEGQTYSITDYNTGAQFDMVFAGGEQHAEMECTNSVDYAAYVEAFGGEVNYSKRPVVIRIGGREVAASLQGYPHGEDTVGSNEMAGHACLFFEGSLSHVGLLPDVEHATQVRRAAGR